MPPTEVGGMKGSRAPFGSAQAMLQCAGDDPPNHERLRPGAGRYAVAEGEDLRQPLNRLDERCAVKNLTGRAAWWYCISDKFAEPLLPVNMEALTWKMTLRKC